MNLGWILLGLVGWALGLVVVLALFRMASDQDRAARHVQKRLDPYSDVTITRAGDARDSSLPLCALPSRPAEAHSLAFLVASWPASWRATRLFEPQVRTPWPR